MTTPRWSFRWFDDGGVDGGGGGYDDVDVDPWLHQGGHSDLMMVENKLLLFAQEQEKY